VSDAFFAEDLAAMGVIVLCGAISGVLAMLLYRWTSNQQKIRDTKAHLAQLRRRMLSPDLTQREVMQLSMQNLKVSLGQLGRVTGPSLLSMIPVLLIASWLHTEYCCRMPRPGETVTVRHEPVDAPVKMQPAAASSSPGVDVVRYDEREPIVRIESGGVPAFMLDLRSPPTAPVAEKSWWTSLLRASSLDPRAALEKLSVDLPPREFLSMGPGWLRGWEFLYFVTIFVVALALKLRLKIQ
jgi:hypothetical protein